MFPRDSQLSRCRTGRQIRDRFIRATETYLNLHIRRGPPNWTSRHVHEADQPSPTGHPGQLARADLTAPARPRPVASAWPASQRDARRAAGPALSDGSPRGD